MTSYIGILEKEPGTFWGIWFPDLPGCIAAAPTSEEVVDQAGPALSQWIEEARIDGDRLPPPRSIEAIRQDEDVIAALAKGHVPIVVPVVSLALDIDDRTLRAMDAAAEKRSLSRTDFVREAVIEKLGE